VKPSIELPEDGAAEGAGAVRRLREVMARCVGVERSGASLREALSVLKELEGEVQSFELRGMIAAALLITAGAYARKESRGAHLRLDYPGLSEPARHTYLRLGEAREIMEAATGGAAQEEEHGAGLQHLRAAV